VAVCPSCGRENPAGFRFCGACGADLAAQAPAGVAEVEPRHHREVGQSSLGHDGAHDRRVPFGEPARVGQAAPATDQDPGQPLEHAAGRQRAQEANDLPGLGRLLRCLVEQDRPVEGGGRRERRRSPQPVEQLGAAADQPAPRAPCASQGPPSLRRLQPAPPRLIGRHRPVQELGRPPRVVRLDSPDRVAAEERAADRVDHVREGASVLAEPRHHRRHVVGAHTCSEAGEVDCGRVGVAVQRLGVGADRLEVEVGEDADGVLAADGGDDPADRRVAKGRGQVVRAQVRPAGEQLGIGPRVRHLDQLHAERLLELALASLVAVGERARAAPRRRHRGQPVAGAQRGWDHQLVEHSARAYDCRRDAGRQFAL
jgi:zinc-ribbon domain